MSLSPRRPSTALIRRAPVALTAALVLLALPGPARADLFPAATVIDGPSPDILGLGNLSMSHDATGGLIYRKNVAGVPRVFASILRGGAWGTPQELDGSLPTGSSDPAIAAADKGRLVAVFINNGELYATVRAPRASGFGPLQPVAGAASFPSLGMSINGTAYVSYTVLNGSVHNVFVARLDRLSSSFVVIGQPLDLAPSLDAAATPATRSHIAVATDGQALVTWAENGSDGRTHVVARRVSDQGVSTAPQDLTLDSLNGQPGGSADSPYPTLEDAADFGWVAFRQTFVTAAGPVSRTVTRHQLGSQFDPPVVIDPLAFPTADGADAPRVSIDGLGDGLSLVELTGSHQTWADPVLDPDFGVPERVDAAVNTIPPLPVLGLAYDDSGIIAWQQSVGPTDPPSVRARSYTSGGLGPETGMSLSSLGAVDVADGFSAAFDRHGNGFLGFIQGDPANRRLVVGGVADAPTDFDITSADRTTRRRPVITWSASSEIFGLSYRVDIDHKAVGVTRRLRFRPSKSLRPGRHRVTVVAIDRYGQTTATPTHALIVGGGGGKKGKKGKKKK